MLYRDRWLACDHRERVVGEPRNINQKQPKERLKEKWEWLNRCNARRVPSRQQHALNKEKDRKEGEREWCREVPEGTHELRGLKLSALR